MTTLSLLVSLAHSAGLLAVVTLVYAAVLDRFRQGAEASQLALGLLFGCAAITSMAEPVTVAPGVIADARLVLLGLAGPFAGPVAAIIATGIVGAYRVWVGGAGAVAGVTGACVAASAGIAFALASRGRGGRYGLRDLFVLGGMTALSIFSALLLPRETAWTVLATAGPALTAVIVLGVVALGTMLSRERARLDAAKALREGAALLGSVFDSSSDRLLVCEVGADGYRLRLANQAALAALGRERADDEGARLDARLDAVLPPAAHAALRENLDRCVRLGLPITFRDAGGLPSAGRAWEMTLVPVDGGSGKATLVVLNARDVTEQEIAAEEIRAAREAAEAANRAKGELLAGLSHELRTPLNGVIGFADLIGKGTHGPIQDEYREMAGFVREAGEHLLELINDILDNAKAEAGRLELDEGTVDLAAATLFAERALAPRAGRAGVVVTRSVAPEARLVRGDERRLRQVLLNLVGNAVKFTPSGGKVEVSTRLDPDGTLVLAVSDQGIGIPEPDLGRVLEPFARGAAAERSGIEGTGLGLPLAKRLIELHGGAMELRSGLGLGTTVTVRFPVHRVVAAGGEAQDGIRPARVLVVEDEPVLRATTAAMVTDWGYEVLEAGNANEALAILLSERSVDVLFSDLVMPPGMNGAELALQAERLRPGMRVLLTSGFGALAVMNEEAAARGHDLLPKPYSPIELQRRLATLCPAPARRVAARESSA
jgi:signal transduction histidine kinase/CheY-like chemotaxis protein